MGATAGCANSKPVVRTVVWTKSMPDCRVLGHVKDALEEQTAWAVSHALLRPFATDREGRTSGDKNTGMRDMLAVLPGREGFSAFRSDLQ